MSKLRIALADDHNLVREGLKALIDSQADMVVIAEAADGLGACEQALALDPDVVVMDVSLPGLNGVQATERIKRERPGIRVLALTFHDDAAHVRRLLEAGASGYLIKRAVADELIRAIRIVAGGGTYLDPEIAGAVVPGLVPGALVVGPSPPIELSEREREILHLVARGYTNKEIAAQFDISTRAVEDHKAGAMKRIGLSSRAQVIRYASQNGWLTES